MSRFPLKHLIIEKAGAIRRFDPVGHCIYCLRSPPDVRLSAEHIVADGLGGDLLLPESSCPACAAVTNSFENKLMNQTCGEVRGAMGFRSRKRRGKPTRGQMFYNKDGSRFAELPYDDDSPWRFVGVTTRSLPGILLGYDEQTELDVFAKIVSPNDHSERIVRKAGNRETVINLNTDWWFRTAAKTAHSFAVALLGPTGFAPILNDYILGKKPNAATYFIGADDFTPPTTDFYHFIELDRHIRFDQDAMALTVYYVVSVRFFGNITSPTYKVVVGTAGIFRPARSTFSG